MPAIQRVCKAREAAELRNQPRPSVCSDTVHVVHSVDFPVVFGSGARPKLCNGLPAQNDASRASHTGVSPPGTSSAWGHAGPQAPRPPRHCCAHSHVARHLPMPDNTRHPCIGLLGCMPGGRVGGFPGAHIPTGGGAMWPGCRRSCCIRACWISVPSSHSSHGAVNS
jgi:hypothetical protein